MNWLPFLSSYPFWVRIFFLLWLAVGAGVFVVVPRKVEQKSSHQFRAASLSPVILPFQPIAMDRIANLHGIVTQNQVSAGTVLHQRPDRIIDDEMKAALLSYIPKGKLVKIVVLFGDSECDRFAGQINDFLASQGYHILSPRQSFMVDKGKSVPVGTDISPDHEDPGMMVITVGANDR
jgi:hypothetical protein